MVGVQANYKCQFNQKPFRNRINKAKFKHYQRPENNKEELASTSEVMTKLRNLADPEFSGATAPRTWGSAGDSSRTSRVPMNRKQPEQVATQARVSPFFTNSVDLTAQAVVSADRRYVRLSVNPLFRTVTPSTTAVFSVPLIPGGR